MSAAFQLAWMTAFNAGLLDGLAAREVLAALGRIQAALATETIGLDTPRDTWVDRLAQWLAVGAS